MVRNFRRSLIAGGCATLIDVSARWAASVSRLQKSKARSSRSVTAPPISSGASMFCTDWFFLRIEWTRCCRLPLCHPQSQPLRRMRFEEQR